MSSHPVPTLIALAVIVPAVSVCVRLPMLSPRISPVSPTAFCVAVNASISMTLYVSEVPPATVSE